MKRIGTMPKFLASSLSTTLVDLGLFALIFALLKERMPGYAEIIATVIARLVSSALNWLANHKLVFKSEESMKASLIRYYCLAIPQMVASAGLVSLINYLFANSSTIVTTGIKMVVDVILFFISYYIQRKWVFKKKKENKITGSVSV